MRGFRLWQMTWKEVSEVLPKVEVALITTGSTEQHGLHLPLDTDIASAHHVAEKAAEKLYPKVIIAPPIPFGHSPHHMRFPGSITLAPTTFINLVFEVCQSLKRHGVKRFCIVNGHGENMYPLAIAGRKIRNELDLPVAVVSYWELVSKTAEQIVQDGAVSVGHASDFETSLALAFRPELVGSERRGDNMKTSPYQKFIVRKRFEMDECKTGVPVGDPSVASAEKGRRLLSAAVDELVSFLEVFIKHGELIPV